MPSGRIFRFIGFNGTENGDKVCTLGPKKLIAAVRLAVRVISKKFKVKHPALRVPPGGNQVDGLPPAFNSKKLCRGCRSSKNDFRQNSADYQFFSPARPNLITILGPVKTYKPKNPSGWHYLLEKPSPEMDSNPNSNVWNQI